MRTICPGSFTLFAVLAGGCHGTGEWFLDGYVGANIPHEDELELDRADGTSMDVEYDSLVTLGVRSGHYFDVGVLVQPGLAFDTSLIYLQVDDSNNIQAALSPLVMLRAPLWKSEDHPHGLLRPYIAAGPSLIFAQNASNLEILGGKVENDDTTLGADFRAGFSVVMTQRVGAFVEYRLSYSKPEFEGTSGTGPFDVEMELLVSHVLFGMSYRF